MLKIEREFSFRCQHYWGLFVDWSKDSWQHYINTSTFQMGSRNCPIIDFVGRQLLSLCYTIHAYSITLAYELDYGLLAIFYQTTKHVFKKTLGITQSLILVLVTIHRPVPETKPQFQSLFDDTDSESDESSTTSPDSYDVLSEEDQNSFDSDSTESKLSISPLSHSNNTLGSRRHAPTIGISSELRLLMRCTGQTLTARLTFSLTMSPPIRKATYPHCLPQTISRANDVTASNAVVLFELRRVKRRTWANATDHFTFFLTMVERRIVMASISEAKLVHSNRIKQCDF